MTVFQRRHNVSLATLNRRWNLTLKQRWFWVDCKKLLSLTIDYTVFKNSYTKRYLFWFNLSSNSGFQLTISESFQKMVRERVHFQ